jgi:hypothetical protein
MAFFDFRLVGSSPDLKKGSFSYICLRGHAKRLCGPCSSMIPVAILQKRDYLGAGAKVLEL